MSEPYEKTRETCRPRGEFKHRYWFFADTPNIAGNFSVIWKDLWWWADPCRNLKYRGRCTIPLLQISVWCGKFVEAGHDADIGIQLLCANNRNRVRWAVLGLSRDGACTDLFENLCENSLKGDLSNDTKFNPPLFSLVNTLKKLNFPLRPLLWIVSVSCSSLPTLRSGWKSLDSLRYALLTRKRKKSKKSDLKIRHQFFFLYC